MRLQFSKILSAIVLCLGLATSSQAALVGDTHIPFSADRTVVWKGKPYVGKFYAAPGMQRHEQEISGFHPTAILRADQHIAYLILPEAHLYTQFPFPAVVSEEGGIDRLGPPVARDAINGRKVLKYRLDRTGSDGSALQGAVWITPDGIVMRLEGAYLAPGHNPAPASLELSNVKVGPQDPALFEVPPGFTKVPPELIQSLMTLRGHHQ